MFLRESFPPDATLVAKALSSEPAAFERLVLRYQRKAFAIARALGVAPSSVDDVVQESFLQAFCGLRELRSPASFGPWFLTIVRNISRKEIESSRRPIDPLRLEPRNESEPPSDAADLEEMREHVWREVQCLPEGVREAIFLYYHEGESVRRVAQTLELSASAVKSRLQRGRDQLRQRLWRELEDSLREMLPSTRGWKQRGRRLTLLLLAAASSEKVLAGAEAVAPSPSSVSSSGSLVHAVTTGALLMTIKKLFLGAGLAALLIAASLIVVSRSFHRPTDDGRKLVDSGQLTPPPGPAEPAQNLPEKPAASPMPAARRVTGVTGTVFLENAPTLAAGVFVAAILDGERGHAKETTTGEDGTYVLADLKPGKYLVWAWKDDWTTHSRESVDHEVEVRKGELAAAKELTLVPGVIVEGRVVEEGTRRPIPSASVSLLPVQFGKADDEGRFRLEGLPDGLITIGAKADGYSRGRQEIDVEHGELPSVEIALSPGGIIEGTVTDVDGAAAAGVDVSATSGPVGGGAQTDAGGRYRIDGVPLTARTIDLTASRGGCFATHATLAGFPLGETRVVQDLQLEGGFVLKGRVIDAAGQPAPNAKIHVSGSLAFRKIVADEEGRFVIEGASKRMFSLSTRVKGHAPAWLSLRELPVEKRVSIELVLGDAHFVEGTVVDAQGKPVERTTVHVYAEDRETSEPPSTKTDANGRFRLDDLPPRLREAGASKKGYALNLFNAVRADQRDVRIVLRESGQIQGVVVDGATGFPVHPFVVKASYARGNRWEKNVEAGLSGLSASFDREGLPFDFADGGFKIRNGLASGLFYKLLVIAPGYSETVLDGVEAWPLSESRDPIRVEVEKGNVLRGRVLAARTRDPVAGVKVSHVTESGNTGRGYWHEAWRGEDTPLRVSVTDEHGDFVIEGLSETPGVLLFEKQSFARTAVFHAAPAAQVQVFELAPASAIEGTVRSAEGDPLKHAEVHVSIEVQEFPEAKTDASGSYRIDGLPSGAADVQVRIAGCLKKHAAATLTPGETTVLDFTQGSGAILARVTEEGRPVYRAQVLVKRLKDKEEQEWMYADDQGKLRIGGLEPGSYELKVSLPDDPNRIGGGVSRTIEVGRGEVFTELSLSPAFGLNGRVVERLSGNPARGARVIVFHHSTSLFTAGGFKFPGGDWDPAGSCKAEGEDAHFHLKATAAGSYLLTALAGEGQGALHGWLGPVDLDAGGQADDLAISVGGPAALAVTIHDAKTGAPIEGANIVLRPDGKHPMGLSARSDGSGAASVSNAPGGKYRLEVDSAAHLSFFEENVTLDGACVARDVSLEPASWIVVELGGSLKASRNYALRATLLSAGDPAWTFSSLDGRSLTLGSVGASPSAQGFKMRLKTRAGRYTIRFEVGPTLGVPPLLSQDLDVDVPRDGEATIRLLVPEK